MRHESAHETIPVSVSFFNNYAHTHKNLSHARREAVTSARDLSIFGRSSAPLKQLAARAVSQGVRSDGIGSESGEGGGATLWNRLVSVIQSRPFCDVTVWYPALPLSLSFKTHNRNLK